MEETNEGLGIKIGFRDVTPTASCQAITNGSSSHASEGSKTPMEAALSALVERAGGSQESLVGLDSLQVITLAELIRKEMGKDVSVKDLLHNTDIKQLATLLESTSSGGASGTKEDNSDPNLLEKPTAFGCYRAFTMAFPRHPVDWCVRYEGPGHLDLPALQRASDRLIARHSALRTVQTPDEPIRDVMDRAGAMWQLYSSCYGRDSPLWRSFSKIIGNCLYACWPRTKLRSAQEARLELKIPDGPRVRDENWDYQSNDQYIFNNVREQTGPNYRWPFEIVVVPLYKGAPEGTGKNAAEFALRMPPEDV